MCVYIVQVRRMIVISLIFAKANPEKFVQFFFEVVEHVETSCSTVCYFLWCIFVGSRGKSHLSLQQYVVFLPVLNSLQCRFYASLFLSRNFCYFCCYRWICMGLSSWYHTWIYGIVGIIECNVAYCSFPDLKWTELQQNINFGAILCTDI